MAQTAASKEKNREYLLRCVEAAKTDADIDAVIQLAAELGLTLDQDTDGEQFMLATLAEVAAFFGLDEQTIRTWRLRTPKMPGEPGNWPLRDIVRWRCDWLQQTELTQKKREQEYELGQIQLEHKRIELAKEQGAILDRADVELWAATALVELREGIMRLPEVLAAAAPENLKGFVRQEADRHCRDVLTTTARRLELMEVDKMRESE